MRCRLETIRVGYLKNPEEVLVTLKEILLLLILENNTSRNFSGFGEKLEDTLLKLDVPNKVKLSLLPLAIDTMCGLPPIIRHLLFNGTIHKENYEDYFKITYNNFTAILSIETVIPSIETMTGDMFKEEISRLTPEQELKLEEGIISLFNLLGDYLRTIKKWPHLIESSRFELVFSAREDIIMESTLHFVNVDCNRMSFIDTLFIDPKTGLLIKEFKELLENNLDIREHLVFSINNGFLTISLK